MAETHINIFNHVYLLVHIFTSTLQYTWGSWILMSVLAQSCWRACTTYINTHRREFQLFLSIVRKKKKPMFFERRTWRLRRVYPPTVTIVLGDRWSTTDGIWWRRVHGRVRSYFRCGSRGGSGGGQGPPLDPRFWGPKIEHFWALFNFSLIFFLPRFARHIISSICCFFKVQIQKFSSLTSFSSAYDFSPRSLCF